MVEFDPIRIVISEGTITFLALSLLFIALYFQIRIYRLLKFNDLILFLLVCAVELALVSIISATVINSVFLFGQ